MSEQQSQNSSQQPPVKSGPVDESAIDELRRKIDEMQRVFNEALTNVGGLVAQIDRLNSKVFPSDLKPGEGKPAKAE